MSYENEDQFDQLKEVLKHAVKGASGTVGILGNHDYGDNWSQQSVADEISFLLESAGLELLGNRWIEFHRFR